MKNFSALGSANIIFESNFGNNFLATVSGFNPRSFAGNSLRQRKFFMKEKYDCNGMHIYESKDDRTQQ